MALDVKTQSRNEFMSGGYALPWAFSPEHDSWKTTLQEFGINRIAPEAAQRTIEEKFDPDLALAVGALGAYGLLIPTEYGGQGADLRSLCLAAEETAVHDSSLAVTIHVQAISLALLAHLGKDRPELLRETLPKAVTGETFISFGLTEPTGGTDAGHIETRAIKKGADWVINGSKQFITNSGTPFSKYVILFAATGEASGAGRSPISAFLVPLDAKGVTVGPLYRKLGWRASDTHPLFFDDVRVPGSALLGEEGRGYGEALRFLTWARLPIAAMCSGLARGCLIDIDRFVADRTSFGKPLGDHQAVAFKTAEVAALGSLARVMTYDGAWKYDHGHPIQQEAATAKLLAAEAANKAAYIATGLLGGYGFMEESAATRHYQDARILTIGEGTPEVQKMLIARLLGMGQR
ncbi:acyl-CoA dehydrogenase family protein [Ferrimicrobium sp.]|uniref:acyl-CoA dehydrogenase family protein n=1 Tax=Ferrimicrobium sp. TaxID=2926050 RepID=UPI0026209B8C|nr:acyl-CoA dehydrogenase family protein [Ferrimicrobium sp.]